MGNIISTIGGMLVRRAFDTDAKTFFDAVTANGGTLTDPQKMAVSDLVRGLKANGTWLKKFAIYPFVGGSAAAHAINLKDPATFKLTFLGGVTHSATGALFNGINGYAAGGIIEQNFSEYAGHTSAYLRIDSAAGAFRAYGGGSNTTGAIVLIPKDTGNIARGMWGEGGFIVNAPNTDARGWYIVCRDGGTTRLYKNGIEIANAAAADFLNGYQILLAAGNWSDGTVIEYINNEFAYSDFGSITHDATEIAADYATIQKFQAALSRKIDFSFHVDTEAALTYLAGQGVTLSGPEILALDRHIRDLHGETNPNYPTSDIWPYIRSAYPFIGSTAAAHTLNLRNPAEPLTFDGAMSHSATGVLFAGGVARPGYDLTSMPTAGAGYYSRTDNRGVTHAFYGCATGTGDQFVAGYAPDLLFYDCYGIATRSTIPGPPTTAAYLSSSLPGANNARGFFNGNGTAPNTNTAAAPPAVELVFGGTNVSGVINAPSPTECAYSQVNKSLTPTQELNYYNSIQAFQTTLGRAVPSGLLDDTRAVILLLITLGVILSFAQIQALNQMILDSTPSPAPGGGPAAAPDPVIWTDAAGERQLRPDIEDFISSLHDGTP